MSVSTVDLASADAADQLERSFASTGFAQLVGHGLDPELRAEHRRLADRFFALPAEVKARYIHPDPVANRGFRALGSEALSYSLGRESLPDLFESFNAGPDPDDACPESRLLQPTPWPDDAIEGFGDVSLARFAEMRSLAHTLDDLIGALLGLDWLRSRSALGPDMLATIDYRPQPVEATDGQLRMGEHSDYTTVTLLDADPVPGLQIVSPDGEWVDVVPDEGALLVNVGDLLAMFTNDRWPSTLHRVVPMTAGAAPRRRTVAYFHYPDLDVEVAPLDTDEARYGAVTVEEHLLGKLAAPKVRERSTATSTESGRLGM